MNLNRVARAGQDRHPFAMFMLLACAVAVAACSSGGGGGGTGGRGTGGTAAGTGGRGMGGAGTGGAPVDASDAPISSDTAMDTPPLACIIDGGDASGDCCPDDPLKTQPGACGCGVPDDDSDYDLTPNCNDMCPDDPTKIVPGVCGCFIAETDTDNDGTPDCRDGCPKNPALQAPGLCGCALPDTAAPLCLAHRYRFDDGSPADGGVGDGGAGATTMVRDSVGTAHGTAVNVTLTGTGTLTLAGLASDQYVSLPSGIISGLGNSATFEAWITWNDLGGNWQRVFDFGASEVPGGQGTGQAFVFFTPRSGLAAGNFTLLSVNTVGLTEVAGTTIFPPGPLVGDAGQPGPHHLACVIDGGAGDAGAPSAAVYVDGVLTGRTTSISTLSGLNDANNWLGRSQFLPDPEFAGTYYDFRIHSIAMTQQQISASFAAGPDAP
jgi:hypothetical protein